MGFIISIVNHFISKLFLKNKAKPMILYVSFIYLLCIINMQVPFKSTVKIKCN